MVIDTSKLGASSWKTTVFGIISGVALIVASNPGNFVKWPTVVMIAKFIVGGGLAAVGIFAKDSNVTGGTTLAAGSVPDATLHQQAAVVAATDAAVTKA